MKVLVAQLGARREYAVPKAFHTMNALKRFYTDVYISFPLAVDMIQAASKLTGSHALARLKGRSDSDLPRARVKSFPWFAIRRRIRLHKITSQEQITASWLRSGKEFGELVARQMDSEQPQVYAFTSAAKEIFQRARILGGRTYLDHATAPRRHEVKLIEEEKERFSAWTGESSADRYTDAYHERQREELGLADIVICASSYAYEAIRNEGVSRDKLRVVPLGLKESSVRYEVRLRNGNEGLRVLFVGNDGFRKGIGYLQQAVIRVGFAREQVRVVGNLGVNRQGTRDLSRHMEILGSLPRIMVERLLRWADVLVLPSVSDTFGLVILEALAAGVPVITTTNTCGPDVVRNGIDGYVVGVRDVDAIAEKLSCLACDQELLQEMSMSASRRAEEYTLETYAKRLVGALGVD